MNIEGADANLPVLDDLAHDVARRPSHRVRPDTLAEQAEERDEEVRHRQVQDHTAERRAIGVADDGTDCGHVAHKRDEGHGRQHDCSDHNLQWSGKQDGASSSYKYFRLKKNEQLYKLIILWVLLCAREELGKLNFQFSSCWLKNASFHEKYFFLRLVWLPRAIQASSVPHGECGRRVRL